MIIVYIYLYSIYTIQKDNLIKGFTTNKKKTIKTTNNKQQTTNNKQQNNNESFRFRH
jgi:hypothetical protein